MTIRAMGEVESGMATRRRARQPVGSATSKTSSRVLVVEDEQDVAELLRYHLTKEGDEVMQLESESPDESDRMSSDWCVLSVKNCEESNLLMVLRRAALASRNLPILFFRVHLPGRWYSAQLGIGLD